jgi:hypothetical protein
LVLALLGSSREGHRAERYRGTETVVPILTEHIPRGERLIDVLIGIAKAEYPDDWSHYCDLAQSLAPETDTRGPDISAEDCARRRFTGKDPNAHGLIADFFSSFVGRAPSQLQQMTWEASRLEQKFRDRLVSVLCSGGYLLIGFDPNLRRISIPSELINAKLLALPFEISANELPVPFDCDQIQLGETIIGCVRALPAPRRNEETDTNQGGPRPGRISPKDQMCREALAILDSDHRPPKGRGRFTELARKVRERYPDYAQNTIERTIRSIVKEWEQRNPDR